MSTVLNLTISETTLAGIHEAASRAGACEVMGLLLAPRGCEKITEANLLSARASAGFAETDPITLKQSADEIIARGMVPRGIWHSHGHLDPFHSGTDNGTIRRLFPALADWNWRVPRPTTVCPTIEGPDTVVLPMGPNILRITAIGPEVPGLAGDLDARECRQWAAIGTEYNDSLQPPSVVVTDQRLRLVAGRVVRTLDLQPRTSLLWEYEEQTEFRYAHLFSLVVNSSGQNYAERVLVQQQSGRTTVLQEPCDVVQYDAGHKHPFAIALDLSFLHIAKLCGRGVRSLIPFGKRS